jgi:hypothetical protein
MNQMIAKTPGGWKTTNILPTPAVIANILPGEAVHYVIAAIRRL